MPFIVIEKTSSVPFGRILDAYFCPVNVCGEPDFRRRQPVQIQRLSDGALMILPHDRRTIISSVVENSKVTFHVEPGRAAEAAAVLFARLVKARELLQQFASVLTVVEPPAEVTAGLETLSRWLDGERQKVTERGHEHA